MARRHSQLVLAHLVRGPVLLGDWLAPGGAGAFIVPRLATALIVPAALLLTDGPSQKSLVIGGGLLALAFVWRFQYAPAMSVFAGQ
jgi:hypothetical protein